MKVKPLLSKINPHRFIEDYLSALEIKDVEKYLSPVGNYDNPSLYVNMDVACYKLKEHLVEDGKIGILCDEDNDGECSCAVIYSFIKSFDIEPIVFFHKVAKAHGLTETSKDLIIEDIISSGISLLIIPDASADAYCSKELKQHGIDVICLDHHKYNFGSNPYAIIVNCLQQDNTNQNASGTLVTAKFCQRFAEIYNCECPDYTDLVAASLISDVMDLRSIENRQYINDWLKEWHLFE